MLFVEVVSLHPLQAKEIPLLDGNAHIYIATPPDTPGLTQSNQDSWLSVYNVQ